MTEAQVPVEEQAAPDHPGRGADNWLVAVLFTAASVMFVLFFTQRYTVWQNSHWYDVAFGLWGLYWGVFLAWGALRMHPRKGRAGLFHAFLWMAGAQGFFLALGWGIGWLDSPEKPIAYAAVGAFCASPLLGIALAITGRRWLVILLAELLGPAAFFALHFWGG